MRIERARGRLTDLAICLPLLAIGLGGTGPAGRNQPASTRAPDHLTYLPPTAGLLRVAVKDAIDMAGVITTAGWARRMSGWVPTRADRSAFPPPAAESWG